MLDQCFGGPGSGDLFRRSAEAGEASAIGVDAPLARALAAVPSGRWVLSAEHEERRCGMLLRWVQRASFEPPMISVCVAKGHRILPLISESRRFGLAQLGPADRTTLRRFSREDDPATDPFLGTDLAVDRPGGPPIPHTSVAHLSCELVCHIDVEGDHDLFVGRVIAAGSDGGKPTVLTED